VTKNFSGTLTAALVREKYENTLLTMPDGLVYVVDRVTTQFLYITSAYGKKKRIARMYVDQEIEKRSITRTFLLPETTD
jgi:hypothetical protein